MSSELTARNEAQELQTRPKQAVEREGTRPGSVFRPDVDIIEQGDAYVLMADLPGVDAKHVDVRLENGVLTLDATLAVHPETGWVPRYAEYRLGSYHREFQLSDGIDEAGISAAMRDGVLELRLPKAERHRPRTISIQSG
jgi:HSP20 family protein